MGCGGTGLDECFCAGDFCACSIQGTFLCEGCIDCNENFLAELSHRLENAVAVDTFPPPVKNVAVSK